MAFKNTATVNAGDIEGWPDAVIEGAAFITGPDGTDHIEMSSADTSQVAFVSEHEALGWTSGFLSGNSVDPADSHSRWAPIRPAGHASSDTPFISQSCQSTGTPSKISLNATEVVIGNLADGTGKRLIQNLGRLYNSADSGWRTATLLGSWATLGGGWPHPRYRLAPDGHIDIIAGVTGGVAGTAMFALTGVPAPTFQVPLIGEAAGAFFRATVTTSGNVLHSVGATTSVIFWGRVPAFS